MRVTPLEVRQQQFPVRFRGLDPTEVDKFLELVAGQMEELIRDNARLREGLARKDQEIQRMQQGEEELKKALAAIQEIRDEWIGRAEKQAEQVLIDSELRAKQTMLEAEKRLESLQYDVQELQRQRRHLVSQLRGVLEEHLHLLDAIEPEHEAMPLGEGAPPDLHGSFEESPEPSQASTDPENGAGREGSV